MSRILLDFGTSARPRAELGRCSPWFRVIKVASNISAGTAGLGASAQSDALTDAYSDEGSLSALVTTQRRSDQRTGR